MDDLPKATPVQRDEISVDHHFVPVSMLKRWSISRETTVLRAYYWDVHRSKLATKSRGPKAFCYRPHLLTAEGHPQGPDYYEREVFGPIDTLGSEAIAELLAGRQLDSAGRKAFTEFLLSLEARRPAVVSAIRTYGAKRVAKLLDQDPALIQAVRSEGHTEPPSVVQAKIKGMTLKDELVKVVEMLCRQSGFAKHIVSAFWQVRRVNPTGSLFALGDRPLIRFNGTDDHMVWALPLSPEAVFIATGNDRSRGLIAALSPKQLVRGINSDSVAQCDRYVFWTQEQPTEWLKRRLEWRFHQPKQSPEDFSLARG